MENQNNEEMKIAENLKAAFADENKLSQVLTGNEIQVLKFRFGLTDGNEKTLEETGKKLGITRERVRQIEAKALKKLKESNLCN